jgi:[ribosomal protein S18]-alanine N-acetyltransferase
VLVGYGTFGSAARVPGGGYREDPGVVDLGMGLRPDLVGKGHGADALNALIVEAARRFSPTRYRVTVASANRRATALVKRLGFQPTHRFERPSDGREFVQYERDAMHHARAPMNRHRPNST